MKNILVDALRQANSDDVDADHVLSDSGSFDAPSDELLQPTANDETCFDTPEPDGELALMETSAAIEVPVEPPELPDEFESELPEDEPGDADDDFGATDEPYVETFVTAEEEQLHQTTELVVREPDERHAITIIGTLPRPVPPLQAPMLARLAPLICIALAAAVAGGWLLYQKIGVAHGAFGSSALIAQARAAHTPGIPEAATIEGSNARFPFLTIENDHDVERVVQ